MNEMIVGIASVCAFSAAFVQLGTANNAREAIFHSRNAAALLMDREIGDTEKERLVRKSAIAMTALLGAICLNVAAVLAFAFAPVVLAAAFGITSINTVTTWFASATLRVCKAFIALSMLSMAALARRMILSLSWFGS